MMYSLEQIALLERVEARARDAKLSIYLVGGAIRDLLLGQPSLDFDLVVEGNGIEFAQDLQSEIGGEIKTFPNFLTAKISRLLNSNFELDVASAREEIYERGGALPVVKMTSLDKDLKRRDFTINAMAVELPKFLSLLMDPNESQLRFLLLDPFFGLKDLDNRLIRVLHRASFLDDPTRIFRAIRYAARIDGQLETETLELVKEALNCGALKTISKFRIKNEIGMILQEKRRKEAMREVSELGVLDFLDLRPVSDEIMERMFKHRTFEGSSAELLFPTFLAALSINLSSHDRAALSKAWEEKRSKIEKIAQELSEVHD